MDFLDLIIVCIIFANIGLGWAFGLVRRVVAFAGLFAGVGAATLTSANTSTYIASTFGITSALWAHVITYTVIVTAAIILFALVIMRMAGIVRQHEEALKREAALRKAGEALVTAFTREQIYSAALKGAQAMLDESAPARLYLSLRRWAQHRSRTAFPRSPP